MEREAMTKSRLFGVMIVIVAGCADIRGIAGVQDVLPDTSVQGSATSAQEQRAAAALESAGFTVSDVSSLIIALNSADTRIVADAISLAPRFGQDPVVVSSLRAVMDVDDLQSSLAVLAILALQKIGATGWEASARLRMQTMRSPVAPINLAAALAKTGSADGWPLVRERILDRAFFVALEGLVNVDPFDGLLDENGRSIDVVAELSSMREEVLPELRSLVDIAVERVMKSRSR
jgi:hypothetical protein